MENHHFRWVNQLHMAIFNRYVSLPEVYPMYPLDENTQTKMLKKTTALKTTRCDRCDRSQEAKRPILRLLLPCGDLAAGKTSGFRRWRPRIGDCLPPFLDHFEHQGFGVILILLRQ